MTYFFGIDIPEEEARYWTRKLEQINSLGDDEVNVSIEDECSLECLITCFYSLYWIPVIKVTAKC